MADTVTEARPAAQPRRRRSGAAVRPIPRLENGDRLTRWEFERRYNALPDSKRAELIEGVVHMPSPLHFESHGEPHGWIVTWLGTYAAVTPGIQLGDNATVRLDPDNEPQPDALLRLNPEQGGRSRLSDDDYIEGPPELIVEIAASSASYDLHDKLNAYRRNGVQEYAVWETYEDKVTWVALREGEYVPLTPDENGVIHSRVFPGLRLAVPAMLEGDLAAVLAELQKGLATPEHAAFVERLKEKR